MKSSADTRKPYTGPIRSLVLAFDVGTTFSGVSYAILEPGEIPKIHGVTRFPGQEHVAGNSKIPTIMYYDREGKMMAAGAEADTPSMLSLAEDEGWIKVELFKLRLRPRTMKLNMNGMRLGPLPYRQSAVDVFGDFLSYLFLCTRNFIRDTHANGASLWKAVEHDIQFVLSHPNGWEGAQQTKMRRAAVYGGLIPGTNEGKARIRFVTEGEASLHACVLNGLADDVLIGSPKSGFLVLDAGGGTLDISSYSIRAQAPLVIEEVAPPDCVFAGSVFVSRRARELFQEKLKNSKYGTPDAVDHITKRFDETTKRLFRDKKDSQFILFGSPLDKDLSVGIRSGQLKLSGTEVAELFEPSVQAAVHAIKAQVEASSGMIKSVFLVGGYANSAWLFSQLQKRLEPYGVAVSRPDTQTSKAVADGAIGFYCDHHVSARMSKFMYGVEYLRQYDSADPEHVERKDRLCELPSGPRLLPDAFDCILARGVKVKESTVFTRKYCTELTSLTLLSVFEVEIWCYRGGNTIPKWIMRQAEDFSTLCLVRADLSPLSSSAEAKTGKHGRVYWNIVFSVEIHFGLTEFRARIKWVDNGVTKYGPASIIYNERGHRLDEDEPDSYPEDDMTPAQSRANRSLPGSRAHSVDSMSFHTPAAAMSTTNSKRSSMLGPARNEPPPAPGIPEVVAATPSIRANSVRPSRLPSLSRTPTENGSRVDLSREQSRGRSSYKGKERAIHSPPADDSTGTASTSTRNSSSRLADTLSSVWGAVSPTARSIAESLKSKEATPLSSPVKRELREILHAPPEPPPEIDIPSVVEAPLSAIDMPGAFDSGMPAATVVDQAQAELPATVESFGEAAAWGSFTSAGEAAGANLGPTNLRISTALSNRAPSAVISPITLPEMNFDLSSQPIADAGSSNGMLSLLDEAFLTSHSNISSDLVSAPPESSPSNANNLADLLGNGSSSIGIKSPMNATSPTSTSSKNPWSAKASPKTESSPNTTNPTTPAAEVPPASSKSPLGTPKPAATPKAASKAASKNASKTATPLASATPKPAATPKAATPIPASSPKPETIELPPPPSESVEPAVEESQVPPVENGLSDVPTQTPENTVDNAVPPASLPSESVADAAAAQAEIPPVVEASPPAPAETPAEPAVEAAAETTQPSDATKEATGTPSESAPGTAPGTPGEGLNGADIEGEAGEEGDEKEGKDEEEQATTPGKKKKNDKKKKKKGK